MLKEWVFETRISSDATTVKAFLDQGPLAASHQARPRVNWYELMVFS